MNKNFSNLRSLILELKKENDSDTKNKIYNEILLLLNSLEEEFNYLNIFGRDLMS